MSAATKTASNARSRLLSVEPAHGFDRLRSAGMENIRRKLRRCRTRRPHAQTQKKNRLTIVIGEADIKIRKAPVRPVLRLRDKTKYSRRENKRFSGQLPDHCRRGVFLLRLARAPRALLGRCRHKHGALPAGKAPRLLSRLDSHRLAAGGKPFFSNGKTHREKAALRQVAH